MEGYGGFVGAGELEYSVRFGRHHNDAELLEVFLWMPFLKTKHVAFAHTSTVTAMFLIIIILLLYIIILVY